MGIPALANALITRRLEAPASPEWGRRQSFAWGPGDISFQRLGSGRPVLLLHSFGPGASAEEWRGVAELLAESHEVFAPDHLGWGHSARPARSYDGELYLRFVTEFTGDVIGGPAAVAAAGMSAAYAVQAAADHPELYSALALIGPLGIEPGAADPDLGDAVLFGALRLPILGASAVNLSTSRAALERWLRHDVLFAPERVDAALIERHYRFSHLPGSGRPLASWWCGYLNLDASAALTRIRQPIWLGWGRESRVPPPSAAERWLQLAPQAESEIFGACRALPHLENPRRVVSRLSAFFQAS